MPGGGGVQLSRTPPWAAAYVARRRLDGRLRLLAGGGECRGKSARRQAGGGRIPTAAAEPVTVALSGVLGARRDDRRTPRGANENSPKLDDGRAGRDRHAAVRLAGGREHRHLPRRAGTGLGCRRRVIVAER